MHQTTLILPGYHGSGPAHWQTWMQERLPGARRVSGIDWESPILSRWTEAARRSILDAPDPVWLVAHSFGCLTAVSAGVGLAGRIAGALLVAPADPQRFSSHGVRTGTRRNSRRSLAADLPFTPLPFPSLVVASRNDPWMRLETVEHWAGLWGSTVIDIGEAGHINVDSGFGPWPQGLALLRALQSGRFQRLDNVRETIGEAMGYSNGYSQPRLPRLIEKLLQSLSPQCSATRRTSDSEQWMLRLSMIRCQAVCGPRSASIVANQVAKSTSVRVGPRW